MQVLSAWGQGEQARGEEEKGNYPCFIQLPDFPSCYLGPDKANPPYRGDKGGEQRESAGPKQIQAKLYCPRTLLPQKYQGIQIKCLQQAWRDTK